MMRLVLLILALLFAFGAGASAQTSRASDSAARPRVVELTIGDEIEPIMAEYIDGGISDAAKQHASLILITMDTPGGLGTSMEDIIQHILSSPVPVVVYVSPVGARGASAGFFILLSADVAAMAPGTHAGAASPLIAVGGVPLNVDETLKKKILNDATAFLRSYAGKRGRNVQIAETAVTDGKAFTETEALSDKLVDLVANSPEDLFSKLNGQTIKRFDGSETRLSLDNPEIVTMQMSARQRFLARLGPEATDALDEFLNLALDYENRETPSLQGFVAWLRAAWRGLAQAELVVVPKRRARFRRDEPGKAVFLLRRAMLF